MDNDNRTHQQIMQEQYENNERRETERNTIASVDETISLTREGADRIVSIANNVMETRNGILRDTSNAALAVLGGVLTILTVAPQLIKTPIMIGIGIALITISAVGSFYTRYKYAAYLQSELFFQASEVVRINSVALPLKRNPLGVVENADYNKELGVNKPRPTFHPIFEQAVPYTGLALFIGSVSVAVGLLLVIGT
jgi:hypothetical protein